MKKNINLKSNLVGGGVKSNWKQQQHQHQFFKEFKLCQARVEEIEAIERLHKLFESQKKVFPKTLINS